MWSDNLNRYLKSKSWIPANLSGVYEKESTKTTHLLTKEINLEEGNIANEENKQGHNFKSVDYSTLLRKDELGRRNDRR